MPGFISGLPAEKSYDAEVKGLYVDPDARGQTEAYLSPDPHTQSGFFLAFYVTA